MAECGVAGWEPGAVADDEAWQRQGPLPLEEPSKLPLENPMEECEDKEGERWSDRQAHQQDLELAADLSKTLLARNSYLEKSLQQMSVTHQEQVQVIEHLTKNVELLKQIKEQQSEECKQVDVKARELEDKNLTLAPENKTWQQKIRSLQDTLECLQTHNDHLQSQVEELKSAEQRSRSQGRHLVSDHVVSQQNEPSLKKEEEEQLKHTLAMLQGQLNSEQCLRQAMEEKYGLVLREKSDLEQQLATANSTCTHTLQLEAQVAELRQLLHAQPRPKAHGLEKLVSDSLLLPCLGMPDTPRRPLKRSSSDTMLSSLAQGDLGMGHEVIKQPSISLLQEVHSQYSALKIQYEELLCKCHQDQDLQVHKAVQTSRSAPGPPASTSSPKQPGSSSSSMNPPKYKALFEEIFSCIHKTKQEIHELRARHSPKYKALFEEIFNSINKAKQEVNEQRDKCPGLAPYSSLITLPSSVYLPSTSV